MPQIVQELKVRQEFLDELDEASWDRKKLISLMARIDADKRSVRSQLSRLSSEPRDGDPEGRERQRIIRRMKDKSSFLTEEREAVRARLGQLKHDQAALGRARNRQAGFAEAFLAAASEELSEATLAQLEQRASIMLLQSNS